MYQPFYIMYLLFTRKLHAPLLTHGIHQFHHIDNLTLGDFRTFQCTFPDSLRRRLHLILVSADLLRGIDLLNQMVV